jgi:uncharacterized protein YdhG (YjbR/CyaY superfamily)
MMKKVENIDQYIAEYPEEVKKKLMQIRELIGKHAPDAEECISYGIPTFKLNGNLVHFAAFKNHLGFYPGAAGVEAFSDLLDGYETSKGTIQFPLEKPIPVKLIRDIVKFRVEQNLEKAGQVFFNKLPKPAQRALKAKGITDLKKLSSYSEQEISALHGMGPSSMPILKKALSDRKLSFKRSK